MFAGLEDPEVALARAFRWQKMIEAAARGLPTYAMLCPLLPGIADSPEQVERMVRFAVSCGAEEIFAEPVNPRGPGLRRCQEALELWGYVQEAQAVARIRKRAGWSNYVVELLANVQQSVRKHSHIAKLRFLLYPSRLLPEDLARIRQDDAGVLWLGRKRSGPEASHARLVGGVRRSIGTPARAGLPARLMQPDNRDLSQRP